MPLSLSSLASLSAILALSAPDAGTPDAGPAPPKAASYETVVTSPPGERSLPEGRATSQVRRSDLHRRLPRSAPDALRFEPGVFVQQTAHAQGSAFIRGMTGQQTLLLFDGIRLNNSTYRQGPNQYFFTLDSRSVDSIEVLRGGASTRYGSDALGGVVEAHPIEPTPAKLPFEAGAQLMALGATADAERGGRVQFGAAGAVGASFVGGVGGRRVGLLTSGGPIKSPADGKIPDVPRFDGDGRTQLGTGFDELTGDARLVLRLSPASAMTVAAYLYRQLDAPRTDQCPPPAARFDECLTYDEQFRTLAYAALSGQLGAAAESLRVTLSFQRQHERRRNERPASFVRDVGRDDVDTFGVTAVAATKRMALHESLDVRIMYGGDTYFDRLASLAWLTFSDVDLTVQRGRGQYLDGSTYLYGGAFVEGELEVVERIVLRSGGRMSWTVARARGDPDSGTRSIDRSWFPVVGHAGVEARLGRGLSVLAGVDRSVRVPNLDDLTSRQQTGPGFQVENPELGPESATSIEAGVRYRSLALAADAWVFRTALDGAVGKASREASECPPSTPQCQSSWTRFQLVNARDSAEMVGVEAAVRLRLGNGMGARMSAAWTRGEGPNLAAPPSDPSLPYERRVPLSRVPPLNGTAEVYWAHEKGPGVGGALRWAAKQERLAIADRSDARIPQGGTPGFAVIDLRASYRFGTRIVLGVVLENLLNEAYRYHGSSVNGPGRGLVVSIQVDSK